VVIQIPSGVGGQWIVRNRTSGAYTITINSGGGGTSVVIAQGTNTPVFSDGTNISLTNTQASPGSNTQVIYNSSGSLVGSSNLTFDGTNLTAGGTVKSSSGGIIFPDGSTQTVAASSPIGSMIMFAASTPPTGWLECNGSLVSTTTYANLYGVIGTTFGSGSGTFGLPDMRGYFARGWDHGAGVDSGRAFGSTQTDAFQGHLHPQTGATLVISSFGIPGGYSGSVLTTESANTGSPVNDGTNGVPRTASETRPKNVALMYIIKT